MIFFSEMNTVICLPEDGDGIPGTFPKSEDGISALRIECAALIFRFFHFSQSRTKEPPRVWATLRFFKNRMEKTYI